jgi:hypothetical protein
MKEFIRKTLIRAAVYFTVLTAGFALVILLVYSDSSGGANLSALRTFLFLPFSLCFAAANTVVRGDRPGPAGRWAIHCLLSVVSGYLCLILPATADRDGSEKLIGFIVFLVCYLIAAATVIIAGKRVRDARDKEEYYRRK